MDKAIGTPAQAKTFVVPVPSGDAPNWNAVLGILVALEERNMLRIDDALRVTTKDHSAEWIVGMLPGARPE